MGSDAEWMDDVQRWYYGGPPPAADAESEGEAQGDHALGYEAAHPALQARHWPDAPASGKVQL